MKKSKAALLYTLWLHPLTRGVRGFAYIKARNEKVYDRMRTQMYWGFLLYACIQQLFLMDLVGIFIGWLFTMCLQFWFNRASEYLTRNVDLAMPEARANIERLNHINNTLNKTKNV